MSNAPYFSDLGQGNARLHVPATQSNRWRSRGVDGNCVARHKLWFILTATAFLIWTSIGPTFAQSQSRPTISQLVEFFDSVVFGENAVKRKTEPVIRKWVKSRITYTIRGQKRAAAAHQEKMERHMSALRRFSSLPLERVDTKSPNIDVVVWMARPDRMNQVGRSFESDEHVLVRHANGRCYTLTKVGSRNKIAAAIVIINKSLPDTDIDRCILRGLARSLGFRHTNPKVTPSVFNADEQHAKLTFIDNVLIRTLYDSRVVPGTPRTQALRVVRDVMEDLSTRARKWR